MRFPTQSGSEIWPLPTLGRVTLPIPFFNCSSFQSEIATGDPIGVACANQAMPTSSMRLSLGATSPAPESESTMVCKTTGCLCSCWPKHLHQQWCAHPEPVVSLWCAHSEQVVCTPVKGTRLYPETPASAWHNQCLSARDTLVGVGSQTGAGDCRLNRSSGCAELTAGQRHVCLCQHVQPVRGPGADAASQGWHACHTRAPTAHVRTLHPLCLLCLTTMSPLCVFSKNSYFGCVSKRLVC